MLPSEMGATHGSKIKSRTTHFPRKSFIKARARTFASTKTRSWEAMVKMKVFLSARWKT